MLQRSLRAEHREAGEDGGLELGERRQQRGQHVLVAVPDQAAAPFDVAPSQEAVERELTLLPALVDILTVWKGKARLNGPTRPPSLSNLPSQISSGIAIRCSGKDRCCR